MLGPDMESEQLLELLKKQVKSLIGGQREVAVAYSGGLDSSIVAALASESASVRAYTCAVVGSHDAKHAEECARIEGLSFNLLLLEDDDLISLLRDTSSILPSHDPGKIAYSIPICCAVEKSIEKAVLTGSGADELFGGYAKYISSEVPEALMEADLRKAIHESSVLSGYAAGKRKLLFSPFLSDEVIRLSRSIALPDKIRDGRRKIVLRELARNLGLRSHDTPKKAAQYSSGILRSMQRLAKAEGLSVSEWVAKVRRA